MGGIGASKISRQRSNQMLPKRGASKRKMPGFDTSSESGVNNEEQLYRSTTDQININDKSSESGTSHDTGTLSIFGNRSKPRLDWREFFKDQELEKAY